MRKIFFILGLSILASCSQQEYVIPEKQTLDYSNSHPTDSISMLLDLGDSAIENFKLRKEKTILSEKEKKEKIRILLGEIAYHKKKNEELSVSLEDQAINMILSLEETSAGESTDFVTNVVEKDSIVTVVKLVDSIVYNIIHRDTIVYIVDSLPAKKKRFRLFKKKKK